MTAASPSSAGNSDHTQHIAPVQCSPVWLHAFASPTEVVVEHGAARRRAALWTAAGGVALLGGAFSLAFIERNRYDAALARDDSAAANHAVDVARYGGTGLFVGGVAVLGVAAALYMTAPRMRERHLIVAPAAGADQVGLALSGGF